MNNYNEFFNILQDLHEKTRKNILTISEYEDLSYKEAMKFMAKDFKNLLKEMDEDLRDNEEILKRYRINRKLKKNLVTTFDTIEYERTEFYDKYDKIYVKLLDEKINLKSYEKFTDNALSKLIENATDYSYSISGKSINPFDKISKGTVMNRIRKLDVDIDIKEVESKKKVKCLYIDADEDHMHLQKRDRIRTKNGNFMGKLIYLYEGYEKVCNGRYKLINKFTFSGLYEKSRENKALWEEVYEYIENNYDINYIKKIYIQGDGANWIKEGINYIPKASFVLDEFHLNKYIDKIINTLVNHKRKYAYNDIYRTIELDMKDRFVDLINDIKLESTNEKVIEESKEYILNNWEAIIKRILDNNVIGCSAESHVGHILSKRMSRNPMGWSKISADKICHLRALKENYGLDAFKLVVLKTKETSNNYYIKPKKKYYHTEIDKNIEPINKYSDWLQAEIPSQIKQEILASKVKKQY